MLVLQITIFGTMMVGLIARKLGIVSTEARKDLTSLVINIVLPCNIITSPSEAHFLPPFLNF